MFFLLDFFGSQFLNMIYTLKKKKRSMHAYIEELWKIYYFIKLVYYLDVMYVSMVLLRELYIRYFFLQFMHKLWWWALIIEKKHDGSFRLELEYFFFGLDLLFHFSRIKHLVKITHNKSIYKSLIFSLAL